MANKIKLICTAPLLAIALLVALLAAAGWQAGNFSVANAQGIVRYASPNGVDAGDCSASASPCRTIQYAVDQAASGDEVRIAAGAYTGINTQGSQSQVVYIAKSISLRGGYTPSNWGTPDPVANPTTLDAESQGRVVTIMGPAEVSLEGLRLTNGRATNMGGLYMDHYTCGGTGRGAGGGVCIQDATVTLSKLWIITNTASTSGGYGGGLFASGANLTLTDSTIQGNQAGTGSSLSYGGGVALLGGMATLENNNILKNKANQNYDGNGGGIYALNTHAWLQANLLRENYVRGDTSSLRLGGGGIAVGGGGVTINGNQIIGNQAQNYTGGGLAWSDGPITVTANLVLDNSAKWGGGMWAGNSAATVDNNVLAGNSASGHGSAIYVYTFNPNTAKLRHNTIARNSGGDGVAVYVSSNGRAAFQNTIVAENVIGVGMDWGTSISFERTLWDSNITNTLGYIDEVGHLEGLAAFAADDGYHLTESSDAVDAGIDAGLTTDIDGDPRPQGRAPDIGADESPFGQSVNGGEVNIEKAALPPRLLLTTRDFSGMPLYLIQQEYLIQVANGLTDTALADYSIHDQLPAALDYAAQVQYPPMSFTREGNRLQWDSQATLAPENLAWVSLVGNALPGDGGQVVTNTASVTYTLTGGGTFNKSVQAASLIPNFPPFITFPEKGEYCLNTEGDLELWGIAEPGADVQIYADDVPVVQVSASITGSFYASFQPAHWAPGAPVVLSARNCTNGNCGDLSNIVSVRQSANGWCPQRSVWYRTMGENLLRWPFRNASGEMSTQDWEIPGAYGFHDTTLKLYECDLPDEGYSTTSIVVVADGVIYQDDDGAPDAEGSWSFSVGAAHNVSIVVSAKNNIGATKTYTSHGGILVDPDGFIFDVTQGLDVISSTQEGVPIEVGNALPGITVTCMVSMPQWGGWVPWPAQYYNNQVNPQITGEDGYFAFFTPPGQYYLQVDGGSDYQSWRSPVVEVITEIVHVNVPLTPWQIDGNINRVDLEGNGPNPATITIPTGASVEWLWWPDAQASLAELANWQANPLFQPRSGGLLDPLINPLGFDGGRMVPGQIYRRRFTTAGTYAYSDGADHTGQVIVSGGYSLFLPTLRR